MDDICRAGFDGFHFDSKVDVRDAVEKIAGRMSLIGNVNNPEVLLHDTPEETFERARYAQHAGVQVVGPECAIPLQTPLENLRAVSRIVGNGP
jgi:[methyl-Co(III) methanol-specific corrinoid protein]:coenzyme M methyltransferase